MADEQSKLDQLIAAGATAEELAQVRHEKDHSVRPTHLRFKNIGRAAIHPAPDRLTPEEIDARRAHLEHIAKVQQRGRDIQDYGEKREYDARMDRMKREAQAIEEQKFNAQAGWPPPPTSERE